jgi:hypothetical protein
MNFQKKKKLENAGIIIFFILLVFILIGLYLLNQDLLDFSPNKKLSSLFSAAFYDLESESIPSDFILTGDKAFSYNLDTKQYSYRYIPKKMRAENANEVKYIVLFNVEDIRSGPYVSSKYKQVTIKIIHTGSKKVIKYFSFNGPTSNRGARLPNEDIIMDRIKEWINENDD